MNKIDQHNIELDNVTPGYRTAVNSEDHSNKRRLPDGVYRIKQVHAKEIYNNLNSKKPIAPVLEGLFDAISYELSEAPKKISGTVQDITQKVQSLSPTQRRKKGSTAAETKAQPSVTKKVNPVPHVDELHDKIIYNKMDTAKLVHKVAYYTFLVFMGYDAAVSLLGLASMGKSSYNARQIVHHLLVVLGDFLARIKLLVFGSMSAVNLGSNLFAHHQIRILTLLTSTVAVGLASVIAVVGIIRNTTKIFRIRSAHSEIDNILKIVKAYNVSNEPYESLTPEQQEVRKERNAELLAYLTTLRDPRTYGNVTAIRKHTQDKNVAEMARLDREHEIRMRQVFGNKNWAALKGIFVATGLAPAQSANSTFSSLDDYDAKFMQDIYLKGTHVSGYAIEQLEKISHDMKREVFKTAFEMLTNALVILTVVLTIACPPAGMVVTALMVIGTVIGILIALEDVTKEFEGDTAITKTLKDVFGNMSDFWYRHFLSLKAVFDAQKTEESKPNEFQLNPLTNG